MKTFELPCYWHMKGTMRVQAEDIFEAIDKVEDSVLFPTNGEYISGSFNTIDKERFNDPVYGAEEAKKYEIDPRTDKAETRIKRTPEDFGFAGGIKNLHEGVIGWCCDNACTFYADRLERHAKEKYDSDPRFMSIFVKEDNEDERDAFCRMLCNELGIEDFGRV